MPNKTVQNQNVKAPKTMEAGSALELDRDKNLTYRPHDEGLATETQEEAYGDGFEPLDGSGKTAGAYPADLKNDTEKKPNEKREKAWMQTNEGVTVETQGSTGGADPAAVKSTEVNQAAPDDQLKH